MNNDPGAALGNMFAMGTLITMAIAVAIASILIFGYPLYVIAQKQGHPSPWWGFVPILNMVLLLQLGDQNPWLILTAFIPCVGGIILLVLSIMSWMRVAEKQGFPNWLGILMIVPIANFIVPFYLALASPPQTINRY